jgi:hypothetical protein
MPGQPGEKILVSGFGGRKRLNTQQSTVVIDCCCHMVVRMGVDTTSDSYDCHGRPFRSHKAKGVANHRDGGCDPTELVSTVQPANTARPVETTSPILPQPVM